jgi:serine/threonine protein kinase
LKDVLGEGGYSVVKLAVNKETNDKVAVKIVTRGGEMTEEDEEALHQEVGILRELDNPNITKVHDFFTEKTNFYVVMELLQGGELFDRIVQKSFYNEKEARDLVCLLLTTLKYLHDRNIVHRDLKPENLLLKSLDNDSDIKLADFGFATKVDGDNITTQCGTPGYMAPDILTGTPYGKAVDMWSFGVILYILLGGYPPFHDENQRTLFRKIMKGSFEFHPDYWSSVSDEAKNLISGLLTVDKKKRLTVDQALAHTWLQKSSEELAATSLDSNLKVLKKYQATRKFRKAVNAVRAVGRMKRLLDGIKCAAAEAAAEEAEDQAIEAEADAVLASTVPEEVRGAEAA